MRSACQFTFVVFVISFASFAVGDELIPGHDGAEFEALSNSNWRTSYELLYWERDNPNDFRIINGTASFVNLDTRSLDFDFELGFAIAAERSSDDESQYVQVRYSQLDNWATDFSASLLSGDEINIDGGILMGPMNPTARIVNKTTMRSIEANVGQAAWDGVRVFAGFRWIQFDDFFALELDFAGTPDDFVLIGKNDLLGFQLGLDGNLTNAGGPVTVSWYAKAGVYANVSEATSTRNGAMVFPGRGVENSVPAFFGEMGMAAHYQFDCGWRISSGYQLGWINGVALGPDQFPNTDIDQVDFFTVHLNRLDHGDVFFHGLRFWAERRF